MKTEKKQEIKVVGDWEPEVVLQKKGTDRGSFRRKVVTRGVQRVNLGKVINNIVDKLRHGYEVRITDGDYKDAVRLFPCLDTGHTHMFTAAQTMGEFRDCTGDLTFHTMRHGEEVQPVGVANELRKEFEKSRASVTPDSMVECPNCGFEFRVGHKNK